MCTQWLTQAFQREEILWTQNKMDPSLRRIKQPGGIFQQNNIHILHIILIIMQCNID